MSRASIEQRIRIVAAVVERWSREQLDTFACTTARFGLTVVDPEAPVGWPVARACALDGGSPPEQFDAVVTVAAVDGVPTVVDVVVNP